MAVCSDCNQEMREVDTCTLPLLIINGKVYERNTVYFDHNERCHDCRILNREGNIHHFGCDMERCPICGGQLISCGCLEGKDVILRRR